MQEILKWCMNNVELLKDILKLLLSLGAFLYATLIHRKSNKRLSELELENQVKNDLINSLKDLQRALEEKQKNEG